MDRLTNRRTDWTHGSVPKGLFKPRTIMITLLASTPVDNGHCGSVACLFKLWKLDGFWLTVNVFIIYHLEKKRSWYHSNIMIFFEVYHVNTIVHEYGIHSVPWIKHHGISDTFTVIVLICNIFFPQIVLHVSENVVFPEMKERCNPCVSKSVQVHCLRHANAEGTSWAINHQPCDSHLHEYSSLAVMLTNSAVYVGLI